MLRALPRTRHATFVGFAFAFACALAVVLLGDVVIARSAHAQGAKIRVRGTAKIVARASRDTAQGATELVLSGSLADDAGQPLVAQNVTIRVARATDAHDPRVAEALRAARGCDRPAGGTGAARGVMAWSVRVAGAGDSPDVITTTDEEGRFCFRARLEPDQYRAVLVWSPKGGSFVDGVERELAFDLSKKALSLRFSPTPRIISLDAPRSTFDVVGIVDDDATPRVAAQLPLLLENESGEVARATTDNAGIARFFVDAAKLGPPGPGELRVSFGGSGGETSRASTSEDVERHVKVVVKVPAANRGELAPRNPEEGIALLAEVTSVAGPVPEGTIEARVGDVVVGVAPVERGVARLTVAFAAQGTEALVRVRYVPASPWYEPLAEPVVRVPIRGPGILAKLPLLAAGFAVLVFFLVGRFSGKRNKPDPIPDKRSAAERDAKPRVEVVRPAARGEGGWRGRVVDAHEGTPIANAHVWIERGTFEGNVVIARTSTAADGSFVLAPNVPTVGDEFIVAEGALHAQLRQVLPSAGELSIALAERRRALLARLVKWARRRGAPFDVRPEPTPGHVRRAASADPETARWAEAVERAAFGPDAFDAAAEGEIERLAPRDAAGRASAHSGGSFDETGSRDPSPSRESFAEVPEPPPPRRSGPDGAGPGPQ